MHQYSRIASLSASSCVAEPSEITCSVARAGNFENTVIPFGNYYTQPKHIQELVALGVKGYYGEGCPHPGVDMIDLKTYVAARTAFAIEQVRTASPASAAAGILLSGDVLKWAG